MKVFIDLECHCREHTPAVLSAHPSTSHGYGHLRVRLVGMPTRVAAQQGWWQ